MHLIGFIYAFLGILCSVMIDQSSAPPFIAVLPEFLCVSALLSRYAVVDLTFGSVIGNFISLIFLGPTSIGFMYVIVSGLATFLGALWAWQNRSKGFNFAMLGFIIFNSILLALYLATVIPVESFQTMFNTDVFNRYAIRYIITCLGVAISEFVAIYLIGKPFSELIKTIMLKK